MKAKVFLDTNTIMDWLMLRKGRVDAEKILELGKRGKIKLQVSALTMANVAYMYGRNVPQAKMYEMFEELHKCIDIVNLSTQTYFNAFSSRWHDFEDALQYYSALEAKANIIVTRNEKDYAESNIPVLTPAKFLKSPQE